MRSAATSAKSGVRNGVRIVKSGVTIAKIGVRNGATISKGGAVRSGATTVRQRSYSGHTTGGANASPQPPNGLTCIRSDTRIKTINSA